MTTIEFELTVEELIKQLEINLKEIPNGQSRIVEKNVEGLNLDRFDCNHPDYHLRVDADYGLLLTQYEAYLTDPRRI